jgi:hypothetical protein
MYVYNARTFCITTNYSIHDGLDPYGIVRSEIKFNEEGQNDFLEATVSTSEVLFDVV